MNPLLSSLNQQQLEAVIHHDGPALVLAGAGSGKTKVLTTRVAWLIKEQQLKTQEILLVTFTNKAASEMNKRVYQLCNAQLPFSGTFHSLCAKILRQHGPAINLNSSFTILDSDDQLSLIKQIYKDRNFDSKIHKPQKIKAMISQAKNEMLSEEEYSKLANNSDQEFASKMYKFYNQQLRQQQMLDFDDLLLLTVQLLQTNKQILNLYQEQFSHVLVDEYQDTNKAQYLLSKLLSKPQNNIYVVGDFSQSIYAWRGADYRNLFYLEQDFEPVTTYKLEQNYRSTQNILHVASQIIAKNTSHPVLNLWTKQTSNDKITILNTASADDEAWQVGQLIKNQLADFALKDIAILYRTNAQSRAFEEVLLHLQLPYRIVGGFKFYNRAEVKDVLCYLQLLVNPLNQVAYQRACKIGKRRLQKFNQWQQKQNQSLSQNSPAKILPIILEITQYLEKYDDKNPEDQNKIDNVHELINVASKFTNSASFLENVALIQDDYLKDYPYEDEPNMVTLMSLHSAKGLEFPVVFIVGLEEGLLPHARSLYDAQQLEEERRLLYVGVTRAKQKLFLSYALERYQYANYVSNQPSRFLNDVDPKLLINKQSPLNKKPDKQNNWLDKYQQLTSDSHHKRRLVIDEDDLDALINDELDIDSFLK